jgi:hypothetical protein
MILRAKSRSVNLPSSFSKPSLTGKIIICRHHQFHDFILTHIALNRNDHRHSGKSGGFVRFQLDRFKIHPTGHCLAMLIGQMSINLSDQDATVFVTHPGGYRHEVNATHDAH